MGMSEPPMHAPLCRQACGRRTGQGAHLPRDGKVDKVDLDAHFWEVVWVGHLSGHVEPELRVVIHIRVTQANEGTGACVKDRGIQQSVEHLTQRLPSEVPPGTPPAEAPMVVHTYVMPAPSAFISVPSDAAAFLQDTITHARDQTHQYTQAHVTIHVHPFTPFS